MNPPPICIYNYISVNHLATFLISLPIPDSQRSLLEMGSSSVSVISLAFLLAAFSFLCVFGGGDGDGDGIPTTLDGPFKPVTVPLDTSFRGNAVDLPHSDPRLQRMVQGFEPEQISVTLSSTYDSVWISWVTGLTLLPFSILFACSFLSLIFLSFFFSHWWDYCLDGL